MRIFLIRHGNTFGEDQSGGKRIFMCGCNNNIPLVQKGRAQARMMAKYLENSDVIPSALYSSHLIRTWEHAVLIQEHFYHRRQLLIPLFLDDRIIELDYGHWSGLTTEGNTPQDNEIIARFGQKSWDDWQNQRIIPSDPAQGWQMTREEIINNVSSFFTELINRHHKNDIVLIIGSQGFLGFVTTLLKGGLDLAIIEDRFKMSTGNFSELVFEAEEFRLISWNKQPLS
jgi:broad specificity phosphatase PhoE